ncbi:MAG: hypothetical protein RL117_2026 [Verrucomicrobiota bacterium]|jgi:hypothetical protein
MLQWLHLIYLRLLLCSDKHGHVRYDFIARTESTLATKALPRCFFFRWKDYR